MKNHKISRILAAIDGSEESMETATHAITIACTHDAELLALTVINTQPWFYSSRLRLVNAKALVRQYMMLII